MFYAGQRQTVSFTDGGIYRNFYGRKINITTSEWLAIELSYALSLYFDFSGTADLHYQ